MVFPVNPSQPLYPEKGQQNVQNEYFQLQWGIAVLSMGVTAFEKNSPYAPLLYKLGSGSNMQSDLLQTTHSFNNLVTQINSSEGLQFPAIDMANVNDPNRELMFYINSSSAYVSILGDKGMIDSDSQSRFLSSSASLLKNLSRANTKQTYQGMQNLIDDVNKKLSPDFQIPNLPSKD